MMMEVKLVGWCWVTMDDSNAVEGWGCCWFDGLGTKVVRSVTGLAGHGQVIDQTQIGSINYKVNDHPSRSPPTIQS